MAGADGLETLFRSRRLHHGLEVIIELRVNWIVDLQSSRMLVCRTYRLERRGGSWISYVSKSRYTQRVAADIPRFL